MVKRKMATHRLFTTVAIYNQETKVHKAKITLNREKKRLEKLRKAKKRRR